jgi:hypothetical protein
MASFLRLFKRDYNNTLYFALVAMASLILYITGFVLPVNLVKLYAIPRLDGVLITYANIPAKFFLIVAFIGEWALYWLACRMASRLHGRTAWLIVIVSMLVFSLVLLWMAPFDAADIYDNIMHGRILGVYAANPFQQVTAQYPSDPFFNFTAWKNVPSAYGPLWEILAGMTARLVGDGIIANVLALKLLPGFFYLAGVGMVVLHLRQTAPEQALSGAVLLGWNPIMLYETWGNGHNDAVMVLCVLLAAWLVLRHHFTLSVLGLIMGTLIKFIPLLLIPAVLVAALRNLENNHARVKFLLVTGLAACLLISVFYFPFWHGFATLAIDQRLLMFTTSIPAVIYRIFTPTLGQSASARLVIFGALGLLAGFTFYQSIHGKSQQLSWNFPLVAFTILAFYLMVACLWFQQWYSLWLIGLAPLLPQRSQRIAIFFSFWVLTKQFIFSPLIIPVMLQHPERAVWYELLLTIAVLGLPWVFTLFNIRLSLKNKVTEYAF